MNDLVSLFVLSFFMGALVAYTGNVQTATKWIGKRLCLDPDLYLDGAIKGSPIQWQTFVTPPTQTALNLLQIITFTAILAFVFVVKWYLILLSLLLALATSVITKSFFPKKLDWYLKQILVFLSKKEKKAEKNKNLDSQILFCKCKEAVLKLAQEAEQSGRNIIDKSLD